MHTACFPSSGGLYWGVVSGLGWGIPTPLVYLPPVYLSGITTPWTYPLRRYLGPGMPTPHGRDLGSDMHTPQKGHGTRHAHLPNRMTHTRENITFPQLCWRAVIKVVQRYLTTDSIPTPLPRSAG